MKYGLYVDYTTGDSEGSSEVLHEDMGVVFDDLETARKGLAMVSEHLVWSNRFSEAFHARYSESSETKNTGTKESINEEALKKPWGYDFEGRGVFGGWRFCIKLPVNDQGETVVVSTPYTGYFETLHKAYIEPLEHDDLAVYF